MLKVIFFIIACLTTVPTFGMQTVVESPQTISEQALTQLPLLSSYKKPLFIGTAAIAAAGVGYMLFQQIKQQKRTRQYRADQEKAEQLAQQVIQEAQTPQGYIIDFKKPLYAIIARPFAGKHLLRIYTDNSRGPESVDQITVTWPYVAELKQNKASDYYLPRQSVLETLKDTGQKDLTNCTFTDGQNKLLVAMTIKDGSKIHFNATPARVD
ncbi:MAG TPA: hypothetical protein VFF04_06355 [Candidatus Babeliales bacterium]|nr:hypothetical protein [Candidatus Babeliales bacterium]